MRVRARRLRPEVSAAGLGASSGPLGVDLHARLTLLLQPGIDPSQANRNATFSMIWKAANGSVLDARKGHFWLNFFCKSTGRVYR